MITTAQKLIKNSYQAAFKVLVLVLVLSSFSVSPINAAGNIWQHCEVGGQAVSMMYEIGTSQWTQNPAIMATIADLQGGLVGWNSRTGTEYNEDVTRLGWIHVILDNGRILSAWVFMGTESRDFYFHNTDTLDWFGADYNSNPQPHIACGVYRVQSETFTELASLMHAENDIAVNEFPNS